MRTGIPRAAVTLCLLLSLLQGSAVTAAGSPPSPTATTDQSGLTISVQLQTDGDARVSLIWNKSLTNETATEAFNSMKSNFNNSLLWPNDQTVDPFNRTVEQMRMELNRPMAVRAVSRSVYQSGDSGQFVISFTWTNFATTRDDGEYIEVGDAFETANGFWLSSFSPDQEFVIRPPPEYRIKGASIGHQDNTIRFNGSKSIGSLTITYESDSLIPSLIKHGPIPPLVLAAGTAILALVVAVFVLSRRQRVRRLIPSGLTRTSPIKSDQPSAIDSETSRIEVTPPKSEREGDQRKSIPEGESERERSRSKDEVFRDDENRRFSDHDREDDRRKSISEEDDGIDPELLSDEERVERLLRKNDGRMKQASIVTETGWSNAKVSLLLSSMDDAERIEKLRIGRENLISLPTAENESTNNGSNNQNRS